MYVTHKSVINHNMYFPTTLNYLQIPLENLAGFTVNMIKSPVFGGTYFLQFLFCGRDSACRQEFFFKAPPIHYQIIMDG